MEPCGDEEGRGRRPDERDLVTGQSRAEALACTQRRWKRGNSTSVSDFRSEPRFFRGVANVSSIEPEQHQSPHSSLRGEENSICPGWRHLQHTSISGQTDSSVNLRPAGCFLSQSQTKPGPPLASQRDRPCDASVAAPTHRWPRDTTCLSLAAGEVKSLHFGTESHSGFSPAAV